MKVKITFLFFLFLTGSVSFAQPPIQWQKSLGGTANDGGWSVEATNDGGCIIVGESSSFDGDVTGNHGGYSDGWIVKLDINGDIEWERTVGGSLIDVLNGVAITPDGGYIVIGRTESDDGDVTGFHGGPFGDMAWVLKLDSMGNIEWNNCYGGTGNEFARNSISLTSDGGYVFSVITNSTDGDVTGFHPPANPFDFAMDIWVVKIDSTGVLQWQKCLGGSKSEDATGVRQTADGGYIVCGSTSGSYDGDVIGNTDTVSSATSAVESIWIVKLDSRQNIVWQKTYGGTEWDRSVSFLICHDNSYTFCGIVFSQDGDVLGHPGDSLNQSPVYWLVNIDSTGLIQWQKCFGGDSCMMNGGNFTRTAAGGYAIGGGILLPDNDFPGFHENPINNLAPDYVVIVSDSVGNLEYQHCYGGYLNDQGTDISVASDNGMFVIGGSVSNDGDVSGHHASLTSDDIWVIKFAPATINVKEMEKPLHSFKVYPNPVSTAAKIAFYLPVTNKVTVGIYDLSGKEIRILMNENLNAGFQQMNWDCTTDEQQAVANGIYMVRITAGEYASFSKIIVIR